MARASDAVPFYGQEAIHMIRRLSNILWLVSLLLTIGVAALWAHGHWYEDELRLHRWSPTRATDISLIASDALTAQIGLWADPATDHGGPSAIKLTSGRPFAMSFAALMRLMRTQQDSPPLFTVFQFNPGALLFDVAESRSQRRFAGFAWHRDRWHQEQDPRVWVSTTSLAVPYWSVLCLTLLLPAMRARKYIRERRAARRKAQGLCLTCGYDLRASFDRCPECGTPIPADLVRRPL